MIYNMLSVDSKDDICYRCGRFFLKECPLYINPIYENCKNLHEIVTMDCGLCEILEKSPKSMTVEDILTRKSLLSKNEQLIFASKKLKVPEIIDKNFELVGFDITDGNYTSLLTNTIGDLLVNIISNSDLTKFGLIKSLGKANEIANFIAKNFSQINHCEKPQVVLIYRLITK